MLLFSDPMVGIMSAMGERWNISPFYVSFIFAPLASNASGDAGDGVGLTSTGKEDEKHQVKSICGGPFYPPCPAHHRPAVQTCKVGVISDLRPQEGSVYGMGVLS